MGFHLRQQNIHALSAQKVILNQLKILKEIIVILLACLIRIFNSFGFALQGLYANEIFPTCVRGLGTGILFSVVSQIYLFYLKRE